MGCRSQAKHVSQYQNCCTLVRVPWAPQGLSKSRTVPGLPVPCRDPLIPPIPLLPAAPPKAMPFPSSSQSWQSCTAPGLPGWPSSSRWAEPHTTSSAIHSREWGSCLLLTHDHSDSSCELPSPAPLLCCTSKLRSHSTGKSGFTLLLPQVPAKPLSNNGSTLRPPSELWHPPSGQEEGAGKQLPPELRLVSGLYLLSNFSRSDPPKRSTQRGKAEPQDKAEEDS